MILFTKDGCPKCKYVKRHVDLVQLEVRISVLGPEDAEALADLAWYGLVAVAEKSLPILVLDDGTYLTGAIRILRHLEPKLTGPLNPTV